MNHTKPRRKSRRLPATTCKGFVANMDALVIDAHRSGVLSTADANRITSQLTIILAMQYEAEGDLT